MLVKAIFFIFCCCFSTVINAKKYTFNVQDLNGSINFTNDNDSIVAQVEFTVRYDSLFIVPHRPGCYMREAKSHLFVYIGWDQLSTFNYPMPVIKLSKGQQYSFTMKIGKSPNLNLDEVYLQLNYILIKDVQKKWFKEDGIYKIHVADYFQRMHWTEFTFPMDCKDR